jgi:serine-type D-Ala-D-Ala carboxypeptidase/endopeptidase (penicillin-binding protein 4)
MNFLNMAMLSILLLVATGNCTFAQTVTEKIGQATLKLETDSQFRHGLLGFCVMDGKTGQILYQHNSEVGLAPASCQKIFTSIGAFGLIGSDYRYKTELSYEGYIEKGVLNGNLHFTGSGDPTLGSSRWSETKESSFFQEIISALNKVHIFKISGQIILDDSKFDMQGVPDGWIWEDIGNYYGAGCWGINWRENQYDLVLQPGLQTGDTTRIIGGRPSIKIGAMINQIKTGLKGSGDNGYIYLAPYSSFGFTQGTIPMGEKTFTISGSMPNPVYELKNSLEALFNQNNILVEKGFQITDRKPQDQHRGVLPATIIMTHLSPSLDSINYWFLKKSINLYGEALIKTISYEKTGLGTTEKGVDLVKDFWNQQGIEPSAINMVDGSGLSPQNRVTVDALVKALYYARYQTWFHSFYSALPEIN